MAKTIYQYEYWFKKSSRKWFWKIPSEANESFSFWYQSTFLKYKEIKFVTIDKRRNYLESEPNYHTIMFYTINTIKLSCYKFGYRIGKNSNTHE